MLDHADYKATTRQHELDRTDRNRSGRYLLCLADTGIDHEAAINDLSEVCSSSVGRYNPE